MYFCEEADDSYAMAQLQARYLQRSFELLVEVLKDNDWELKAQVALWTCAASITQPDNSFIFPYLQKSCKAINTAGLQFVPTCGRPPQISEELHEKLSVLSQAIYFENLLFLTRGGAIPVMTTRI